jgi:hypothetical protein
MTWQECNGLIGQQISEKKVSGPDFMFYWHFSAISAYRKHHEEGYRCFTGI